MSRTVTHKPIVQLHRDISLFHKKINGFYRFNWNEINGVFRSGVGVPALLLENHSSELSRNPNGSTTFNGRAISWMVLDFAGAADDYDKQDDVLDETENIALDIISYLKKLNETPSHWLYGLFDIDSVKIEPVAGLFDNMHGWNVLYTLKNKEPMVFDTANWELP